MKNIGDKVGIALAHFNRPIKYCSINKIAAVVANGYCLVFKILDEPTIIRWGPTWVKFSHTEETKKLFGESV